MAQQTFNAPVRDEMGVNTHPDASAERGDGFKSAVDKINANFTDLYARISGLLSGVLSGAGAPTDDVQAAKTTALTGNNNDLIYTSVLDGADGNAITIAYIDPAGNNKSLGVVVTGTDIVVNLATGVAGAITSTAGDISTAILASTPASALVTTANAGGNDGTGVVIALAAAHLTGGVDGTGKATAPKGTLYVDTTTPDLYINSGTTAEPVWKKITRA